MPIVLTGSDTGLPQSAYASGSILKAAVGYNYTTASRVFTSRSTYEAVPGGLTCTITPSAVGNIMVINAHIAWGGWYGTTDVAANFKIYKNINGAGWQPCGNYSSTVASGSSSTQGVATGCYKYNQGDSNSSFDSDDILIHEVVTSTDPTVYAVWWACGYEANSRTLYWNRSVNTGNSYNPTHTCTITAMEIKA